MVGKTWLVAILIAMLSLTGMPALEAQGSITDGSSAPAERSFRAAPVLRAQPADDLDCEDFDTREEAQAVLDEDSADPNNLDPNGDGIACALLPAGEDDANSEAREPDVESAQSADDRAQAREERRQNRDRQETDGDTAEEPVEVTCDDFDTAEEAQEAFDADPEGLAALDGDGNGIACEELLGPEEEPAEGRNRQRDRENRNQEEEPAPEVVDQPTQRRAPEDLDCIDFDFQEEAQAVYNDDPSDPFNLDPNGDGFACSSLPARDPVVSQVPRTGAGAGTLPPALLFATFAIFSAMAAGFSVSLRHRGHHGGTPVHRRQ